MRRHPTIVTNARTSDDSHACADNLAGPYGSMLVSVGPWEINTYVYISLFIEAGDLIFDYFFVVLEYNLFCFNLFKITTYLKSQHIYNNNKLKSKLSNCTRSSEFIVLRSSGVCCCSLICSVFCSVFWSSSTILAIASSTSCTGVGGGAILPFFYVNL